MKRTNLNFIIDAIAFAGFAVLTTTGVLMRYILPPGSGHHTTIWSLDRHEWGGIHFWVSLIFFLILALHLVLHWKWIASVVTGRPREGSGIRAGLGVIGFITVVALSVSPLLAPVQRDGSSRLAPAQGYTASKGTLSVSSHEYEDISVRGSMTLKEIELTTGVPASYIVKSLGLPDGISENERLGPLKREYEFEMNDVREIVKRYQTGK
ncbi:MAG: DUF4405 domain-containing protein [Gammaproteobacteria bacterium]|nr:DUF4405 domain-containing protein [Gammaproteobacteria bacterium]